LSARTGGNSSRLSARRRQTFLKGGLTTRVGKAFARSCVYPKIGLRLALLGLRLLGRRRELGVRVRHVLGGAPPDQPGGEPARGEHQHGDDRVSPAREPALHRRHARERIGLLV
jgi:hypothetical protein